MDGNGRWAKRQGKSRSEGHFAGMNALHVCVENAAASGVKYLTVYAFSTENWGRPQAEVDALMELVCTGVELETEELAKKGVRVLIIGDRSRFSDKVKAALDRIESNTAHGKTMTLILALNYSSRSEITSAVRSLAERVAAGELKPEQIDEQMISASLYTAQIPDPDLIIRTGGNFRISNFLLWQSAYSEYVVLKTLWPDFGDKDIMYAIREFYKRSRRFGGLDKEDNKKK